MRESSKSYNFGTKKQILQALCLLKIAFGQFMAIVTLTSDYGSKDPYLSSLKGTLLGHNADLQLVDITHEITPFNTMETAFILHQAYRHFPKGTVHLISVQEVNPGETLVALSMDDHFFLCADNGILSLVNPDVRMNQMVAIDFREEQRTKLFPSRDVLAKAAAHLAKGGAIGLLGRSLKEIKESTVIRPRLTNEGSMILGNVLYVDNFGNLITNISKKFFTENRKERPFEIALPRRHKVHKIRQYYHEEAQGGVVAIFNAQGFLEIAINGAGNKAFNGANTLLGVGVMDPITINFT